MECVVPMDVKPTLKRVVVDLTEDSPPKRPKSEDGSGPSAPEAERVAQRAPVCDVPDRLDCGSGQESLAKVLSHGLVPAPVVTEDSPIAIDDKYGWPASTPVPEARGGIYYPRTTEGKKTIKARGVWSRIGKLAGTRVIVAKVHDRLMLYRRTFGSVEDSLLGIEASMTMVDLASRGCLGVSTADFEFITALKGLNDCANPFRDRCVHALAFAAVTDIERAQKGEAVAFRVCVWFKRVLFGLSSHPSVKICMDGLEPAGRVVPRRKPLPEVGCYRKSEVPRGQSDFAFSIPALLREAESQGLDVPDNVEGVASKLSVQLRPYQKQNLAWCMHQESLGFHEKEDDRLPGLNGFFWEAHQFADGAWFYYFPMAGHVLLERPPNVTGGVLADDMGFGKTVSMIALISATEARHDRGGTLVVVPFSLYSQWLNELKDKCPSLKVYGCDSSPNATDKRWLTGFHHEEMCDYDVVVVRLDNLHNLRFRPKWRRLVVDECQHVKNDTGSLARAVAKIDADHVWMLSGTPFTSKIDDLRGVLSILRVWPFTLGSADDAGWNDYFWKDYVAGPWRSKDPAVLPRLKDLIASCTMRHSRDQRSEADDQALVDLPPKVTTFVRVELNPLEKAFNKYLDAVAASTLDGRLLTNLRRAATYAGSLNLATFAPFIFALRPTAPTQRNALRPLNKQQARPSAAPSSCPEPPRIALAKLDLAAALAEVAARPERTAALIAPSQLEALCAGEDTDACEFCASFKLDPVVLPCRHSFCKRCVLTQASSSSCDAAKNFKCASFKCAVCNTATALDECFELVVPDDIAAAARQKSKDAKSAVSVANDAMDETPPASTDRLVLASADDLKVTDTNCDSVLKNSPTLAAVPPDPIELARQANNLPIKFVNVPPPIRHAVAAFRRGPTLDDKSTKLARIRDELYRHRDEDVTAKFVVISQWADTLDVLADSLDPVRYTVDIALTVAREVAVGVHVIYFGQDAVVEARRNDAETMYTLVRVSDGRRFDNIRRGAFAPKPLRVANVPGSALRPLDRESLSRGGSDNRFDAGGQVLAQRPPLPEDAPLAPLMRVQVIQTDQIGKIERVHVRPDGSKTYLVAFADGSTVVCSRQDLKDLGNTTHLPGRIVSVHGASASDPFAKTIGTCHLTDPQKRGATLDMMRRDPMCACVLLTKEATSVGLNITWCNFVVLVEPFKNAASEAQAIARVHRIGQARQVNVLKFYSANSIDERLLYLRRRRGELYDDNSALSAGVADAPSSPDDNDARGNAQAGARGGEFSLSDYQVLYGTDLTA